ncbi:MAG TPA: DUF1564 family protein [Leptospiraceae bacterium]|nr:DUF1564 family protein [Leptospiraceae bacterium]HMW05147.1 DUF1564 family protein [Leptospiraceae bacterium]HMX32592.1 DUF1564 family protein [Leptospiraceae bacterium]HMY32486.1 DUF1564 family protein [Leptospiraceae bacterium]HMZ66626.1 DUF1564 family protein [Leptospiraceae bacterium]
MENESLHDIQEGSNIISSYKISFPRNDYIYSEFSSTILIPDQYFKYFQKKIYTHKGVRSYISYLLSKYQIYITNGLVPSYSNVTTKYQDKGQNLHKIAFRPKPEDWAELKLYRLTFGMSISAFLVYLLIADSTDFAEAFSDYLETVGISRVPNFNLSAKVFLLNDRTNYTIVFQYRKSRIRQNG